MKYDSHSNWELVNASSIRVVLMLFRCRTHIWDGDHKIVHEYGLTWAQFNTLAALRHLTEPYLMSPTQLYDAAQITSGGLTKVLAGLEDKGLIIRVENVMDRRSRLVQLTSSGIDQIEIIAGHLCNVNDELLNEAFTANEQEQFAKLLEKLCISLDNQMG